jgi:formylglycine-generating enzyme required for sulfatase activity
VLIAAAVVTVGGLGLVVGSYLYLRQPPSTTQLTAVADLPRQAAPQPASAGEARKNNPAPAPSKGEPSPAPKGAAPPAPAAKEIVNSVGMKLVRIPAGKFLMGSPANEEGRQEDEGPQHEVEITRPFYMGVYEVTQEEYEKVMGTNPSHFSAGGEGKDQVANQDTRRFPVESVSWNDAMEFCHKLSAVPEERAAGRVYRLPTEAEWEYACRGGSPSSDYFHFGKALRGKGANVAASELGRTAPVGSYPPNGYGLHDMHGNVWEWCQDWKGPYPGGLLRDPEGPGYGTRRVRRGGGWHNEPREARSAARCENGPGLRHNCIGFRVVVRSGERPTALKEAPSPAPAGKEVVNSLGMRLAPIPAGKFLMGAAAKEDGHSAGESPQHEVAITRPFYLGVYEVTQDEYRKVMATNPSRFSAQGRDREKVADQDTRRFPVENVSWDDAVEFCRRLSELPAERRAGRVYRLPTEAEWEYACRGGAPTSEPYHFGKTLTAAQANTGDAELGRTTSVGSYPPNGYGLHDMHGNVWEWCQDWRGHYEAGPVSDPQGPENGARRILRSGSWLDPARTVRSARRNDRGPQYRTNYIGFRVLMVAGAGVP